MIRDIETELLKAISACRDLISDHLAVQFFDYVMQNYPAVEIAPYDEPVFGSKISILLSRFAKAKGEVVKPHEVADRMCRWLSAHSSLPCSIFLGESAFINFKLEHDRLEAYVDQLSLISPEQFIQSLFQRYEVVTYRNNERMKIVECFFRAVREQEDAHDLFLARYHEVRPQMQVISALLYLSSSEYDERVFSDVKRYEDIISQIEEGKLIARHMRSNSIFLDAYNNADLEKGFSAYTSFMIFLPQYLFEYYRDGKSRQLSEVVSIVIHTSLMIWNNFDLRSQLCDQAAQPKIRRLRERMLWVYHACMKLGDVLSC